MKIYHAPNTRSHRIVWLFEELGLPYELVLFKLGAPEMRARRNIARSIRWAGCRRWRMTAR